MSWIRSTAFGLVVSVIGATLCAQSCPAFAQKETSRKQSVDAHHADHCNHANKSQDKDPARGCEDSCNFIGKQPPASFEIAHSVSTIAVLLLHTFTSILPEAVRTYSERPPDFGLHATIDLLALFQTRQV